MLSEESVAYKVLREIRKALPRFAGRQIAVTVAAARGRAAARARRARRSRALEAELGREIEIRARPDLHQEQFEIRATGPAGRVTLDLPWLARQGRRRGAGGSRRRAPRSPSRPTAGGRPRRRPRAGTNGAPRRPTPRRVASLPQPVDAEGEFPILPRLRRAGGA